MEKTNNGVLSVSTKNRYDAMIEASQKRTKKSLRSIKRAITNLKDANKPVTVNSVAKKAKVSRNFIYSNEEAKKLVIEQRDECASRSSAIRATDKSKETIIRLLRQQNRDLRKQLAESNAEELKSKYEELQADHKLLRNALDAALAQLNNVQSSVELKEEDATLRASQAIRRNRSN